MIVKFDPLTTIAHNRINLVIHLSHYIPHEIHIYNIILSTARKCSNFFKLNKMIWFLQFFMLCKLDNITILVSIFHDASSIEPVRLLLPPTTTQSSVSPLCVCLFCLLFETLGKFCVVHARLHCSEIKRMQHTRSDFHFFWGQVVFSEMIEFLCFFFAA